MRNLTMKTTDYMKLCVDGRINYNYFSVFAINILTSTHYVACVYEVDTDKYELVQLKLIQG